MDTKNIKYILFFTLLFFASACCKKGVTTFVTDPEYKNFIAIKQGTYYIYNDTVSNIEDSVWIVSNISNIVPKNGELFGKNYNQKCEDHVEYVQVNLKTKKNDYWVFQVHNNGIYFWDFPLVGISLQLPFQNNQTYSNSNNQYSHKNIQHYPIYNLNGSSYSNVYQIESKIYFNNTTDTTFGTTFFSANNGVIKYSIKNDTSFHVYELVRNQIIK